MKRTDDFLADLETQLADAAAARLRPRRRAFPIRPVLVGAAWATALTAIVIAVAGLQNEVEQPVSPVPGSGGLLTLPDATANPECSLLNDASDFPAEVLATLGILRSKRRAVDEFRVWNPASPCAAPKVAGAGACLRHEPTAKVHCWPLAQVRNGTAVATLGEGERPIVFGLMPDGVTSVSLNVGDAGGEVAVVDNVFWTELRGATAGTQIRIEPQPPQSGCGGPAVRQADGAVPEEILLAVPGLSKATGAPGDVRDLLREVRTDSAWLDQAAVVAVADDARLWAVPVEGGIGRGCDDRELDVRSFSGPGLCLVATVGTRAVAGSCLGLGDFAPVATLVGGRQLGFGLVPHGSDTLRAVTGSGDTWDLKTPASSGAAIGWIDTTQRVEISTVSKDPRTGEVTGFGFPPSKIAVLNGTKVTGLGAATVERLREAGLKSERWSFTEMTAKFSGNFSEQNMTTTTVMYAVGHGDPAHEVAHALRRDSDSVKPLVNEARALAGPDAAIVVIVGADQVP